MKSRYLIIYYLLLYKMQSEYLYGIVIVVILLVILFVYNMTKTSITPAPPAATNNNDKGTPKTPVPTTMNINYNLPGGAESGTLTLSVVNSTTLTSISSITYTTNAVFDSVAGSLNGTSTPLYYIQYDGNGINFIIVSTLSAKSLSRYYLQDLSACKITVTDTNSAHPTYNTNTATANGNVLTLTNGSDKLTITLSTSFA